MLKQISFLQIDGTKKRKETNEMSTMKIKISKNYGKQIFVRLTYLCNATMRNRKFHGRYRNFWEYPPP